MSPQTTVVSTRHRRMGFHVLAVSAALFAAACSDNNNSPPPATEAPTPPDNPNRLIGAYDALPGIQLAITEITGATRDDGTFGAGDVLTVR